VTLKITYTPSSSDYGDSLEKLEATFDTEIWDREVFVNHLNKILAFMGHTFTLKLDYVGDGVEDDSKDHN